MTGIDNIVEMIYSKADERVEAILNKAEHRKSVLIEEAQKKANETREKILEQAKKQKESAITQKKANAKLHAKYRVLEAKESLINNILLEVEEEMKKKSKSKSYADILTHFAVMGIHALQTEEVELVLPAGHEDALDIASITKHASKELGEKVSVTVAKDTIRSEGGLIIRTLDGKRLVDNTFEARLVRMYNKIREKIFSTLFSKKE